MANIKNQNKAQPPASAGGPDDLLENAPVTTIPSRIIPDDDDDDEDAGPPEDLAAGDPPAADPPPVPAALKATAALQEVIERKPYALRIVKDFVIYFHGDAVHFRVGDPDITDPGIMQRAVAERKPVDGLFEGMSEYP